MKFFKNNTSYIARALCALYFALQEINNLWPNWEKEARGTGVTIIRKLPGVGRFIVFRIDPDGPFSRRIKRWHVLSHRARALWPPSGSWGGRFAPRDSTHPTQRYPGRHHHHPPEGSRSSFYRYKTLHFLSTVSCLENSGPRWSSQLYMSVKRSETIAFHSFWINYFLNQFLLMNGTKWNWDRLGCEKISWDIFFVTKRVIRGERDAYFKNYKGPFFERANVIKIQIPLEMITFSKHIRIAFENLRRRKAKLL